MPRRVAARPAHSRRRACASTCPLSTLMPSSIQHLAHLARDLGGNGGRAPCGHIARGIQQGRAGRSVARIRRRARGRAPSAPSSPASRCIHHHAPAPIAARRRSSTSHGNPEPRAARERSIFRLSSAPSFEVMPTSRMQRTMSRKLISDGCLGIRSRICHCVFALLRITLQE